jgi:hypothetical protein
MTSFLFLASVGFLAVLLRTVVATRDGMISPATFESTGTGDPAADTVCGEESALTLPPAGTEWKVCVYRNLTEVEQALDTLETCGIAHREVHALANDTFAIRWR